MIFSKNITLLNKALGCLAGKVIYLDLQNVFEILIFVYSNINFKFNAEE